MNYKEILIEYIKNGIGITSDISNHKGIVWHTLQELGIRSEFLNNKTIFEEIFEMFCQTNFGELKYYSSQPNYLKFLNTNKKGEYNKFTIIILNGKPIIINQRTEGNNVVTETREYNTMSVGIQKTKEKEIKYFKKDKVFPKLSCFVEQSLIHETLGMYISTTIIKTKNYGSEEKKHKIILERDENEPCIHQKISKNDLLVTNGYFPDNANIKLSPFPQSFLYSTKEDSLEALLKSYNEIEKNIVNICEDDHTGELKEYYKKRYKDYPELINKLSLKKV